jgi:MarR family transcriptional regulator, organic hydroperoxide resistance regulator
LGYPYSVVAEPSHRLLQELKQLRPFSPAQEAVVSLLRTVDVVRRRIAETIEPHGVTTQQYNVLRILRGAGDEGLPTLEVAARMIEQTPGITRLLDRLEAKSLVRRERCQHDRRQVLCWITPAGRDLLAPLDPLVEAADAAVVAGLAERERVTLVALLDTIRAGVEAG